MRGLQRTLVVLLAEDRAQRVADLAQRRVAFYGGQDARQQVLAATCRGPQGVEGGSHRRIVAAVAQLGELLCLAPPPPRVHAQGPGRRVPLSSRFVSSYDHTPLPP